MQLSQEMEDEIQKLAAKYPFDIESIRRVYMMGGYEHAKQLLDYKHQYKLDDYWIEQINQGIWDKKNKELVKELKLLNKQ